MSLEDGYFISQIVAAVAVIVSLLFVGYQVRQNSINLKLNTQAVQVSAYHQAIEQIKDAWFQPDLPDLLTRARAGNDALSEVERFRLSVLLSANLFGHEITMHLAEQGLIDLALWENMLENNRAFLREEASLMLLRGRPGGLSKQLLREIDPGIAEDKLAGRVSTDQ